jgi:hypothetical protein
MTTAEYDFRGGIKAEPRQERSRRVVGEYWAYAASGAEVPEKLLGQVKETAPGIGTLEIVDFGSTARMYDTLPTIDEHDRDYDASYWPRRTVSVVKLRKVEVLFDEARAGYTPMPLAAEVGILPSVLPVSDPRPSRGTVTQTIVEPVSATASTEAA